jgi:trk system potassium uptake protein TrkH
MQSSIAVLLANMGFVLQISGVFILIPIVASFILGETDANLALFITATSFLVLGFLTNSLCERKAMTFKQSCALIVLVFVLLSLIGSIPYLYIGIANGDIYQHITDCVFESVSGYTTTGFSVIPDVTLLPQSIILYRSLTQFIGGIGIVVVLLAFFYPEAKLREFAKTMGLTKNNHKIKTTFLFIIGIYCIVTAVMVIIGYGFGYHDLIDLSSIIFSAMSTGGFAPVNDLTTLITQPPLNFIVPFCMIFGASNFLVLATLYRRKFKEFLNSETTVFLIIAIVSTVLLIFFFKYPSYDAGFQVLSAMSTSGFSYTAIASLNDSLKLFLVALMFIGGASFSTAGGIKIYRFLLLIKSIPKTVSFTIIGKDTKNSKVKLLSKKYTYSEVVQAATMIFLTAIAIFIASFIVSYYGFKPINAIFDCTSAIATTGLSTGVVGPALPLELKWLFMLLMILGRVEIMVFLVALSRTREKRLRNNNHRSVVSKIEQMAAQQEKEEEEDKIEEYVEEEKTEDKDEESP